ncbi:hypothetical protein F53441_1209 [Fusarium austroafricanum]|uniref:BTB domain-containing protein n=1 Tax=Fusarium austroafricanum TaxID=2364996 RepID=A0A8H4KW24_9HYPO|nr:hypothetical protein F53441_1209 [Fusarium austroafricanum]
MELGPPDLTLICEGREFPFHQSLARQHSPVLAALLNENSTETQSAVIKVENFDFLTVNYMLDFLYSGDYNLNVFQIPGYDPNRPLNSEFIREALLCHVRINAIAHCYEIPALSQHARQYIQMKLRNYWNDSTFSAVVASVLSSTPNDHATKKMLVSIAGAHLHSLAHLPAFDSTTLLQSFDASLQAQAAAEVSLHKQLVSILSSECDQLKEKVDALLSENEQLRENFQEQPVAISEQAATISENRSQLQQVEGAERRATQAEMKLGETTKTLEACQSELRVITSEKNLLKKRWEDSKSKLSILTQQHDDLKHALDLEKQNKSEFSECKRDELRNAVKAEQKESAKLSAEIARTSEELEKAMTDAAIATTEKQRWQEAYMKERNRASDCIQECDGLRTELQIEKGKQRVGLSLAERDQLQRDLGVEKHKVATLTREQYQAKNKILVLVKARDQAKEQGLAESQKIDCFLDEIDGITRCHNRRCRAEFGSHIERDGDGFIMHCYNCHFKYPHKKQ